MNLKKVKAGIILACLLGTSAFSADGHERAAPVAAAAASATHRADPPLVPFFPVAGALTENFEEILTRYRENLFRRNAAFEASVRVQLPLKWRVDYMSSDADSHAMQGQFPELIRKGLSEGLSPELLTNWCIFLKFRYEEMRLDEKMLGYKKFSPTIMKTISSVPGLAERMGGFDPLLNLSENPGMQDIQRYIYWYLGTRARPAAPDIKHCVLDARQFAEMSPDQIREEMMMWKESVTPAAAHAPASASVPQIRWDDNFLEVLRREAQQMIEAAQRSLVAAPARAAPVPASAASYPESDSEENGYPHDDVSVDATDGDFDSENTYNIAPVVVAAPIPPSTPTEGAREYLSGIGFDPNEFAHEFEVLGDHPDDEAIQAFINTMENMGTLSQEELTQLRDAMMRARVPAPAA